jgi:hypothetical protein
MCNQTINTDAPGNTPALTQPCSGNGGTLPTYQDMYCAKNQEGDGNSQASVNQGTATAFSQADCAQGTTFIVPQFPGGYAPPAGQGVCLFENETLDNYCGTSANGTTCGGYQNLGYTNALGYTCQQVSYQDSQGNPQTPSLCLPPTISGLGTCSPLTGQPSLYQGVAGTFNAAWLTAAVQAATASTQPPYAPGNTPYYATFKTACPAAYTWQYDDAASSFACTVAATVPPNGAAFFGYKVVFCASAVNPTMLRR